MTTTAHEDQYAPEPVSGDPVFETREDLEAWALGVSRGITRHAELLPALDRIRRVTLTHLHLREGEG